MAYITRDYLKRYHTNLGLNRRNSLKARPNILNKAEKMEGKTTIFLSHSHKDKDLIEEVALFLLDQGVSVYVDWKDSSMPENTSAKTANALKEHILSSDKFVVLASNNALDSKWVPWELGFADSAKGINNVYIFPVADDDGTWKGSEYFSLYQNIELGYKENSRSIDAIVRQPIYDYVGLSLKANFKQTTDNAIYSRK